MTYEDYMKQLKAKAKSEDTEDYQSELSEEIEMHEETIKTTIQLREDWEDYLGYCISEMCNLGCSKEMAYEEFPNCKYFIESYRWDYETTEDLINATQNAEVKKAS